jgi:hypothetical protein
MTSEIEIVKKTLTDYGIPSYMHEGIIKYIYEGIIPGSFLRAVLENNLKDAIANADSTNILIISNYVEFFYNEVPGNIWGSEERVRGHAMSFGR